MTTQLVFPAIPRSPMFVRDIMTKEWQDFFRDLFLRVGGFDSIPLDEVDDILNVDNLVASRILQTDANKVFQSITDLTSWIAGTTQQITVTDDGDGTITLSFPSTIRAEAALIIGDGNNGSWRLIKDGNNLKLQVNKSGTWTDTSSWLYTDY